MSGKFTVNQLEELKDVFRTFDSDGSGNMDIDELRSSLTTLEINHTPAEVRAIFAAIDTDGSGAIDWEEFVTFMSTDLYYTAYMHKIIRDGIRKQTLDLSEIQEELAKLGYKISEDNLIEVAKKIVCGYVTVEDFKKMLIAAKE